MRPYEGVWALAKSSFLRSEAQYWTFGNRLVEIGFVTGITVWAYFEFFSNPASNLKFLGLVLFIGSLVTIRARQSLYEGYFNGYEIAFEDVATRHCDYSDDTQWSTERKAAIEEALAAIEASESELSSDEKRTKEMEIRRGFSKLTGFALTWRKVT